ncbi:DUF4382 domain-containing protein [uncultured Massilia sp.]|uniref:DUF4382 domain-containing protein n=1 Tax=uncultured Massilia sp. TaxID=169973 RepID=UPI0025873E9E|nr:DUF4382 domain-containing protein [uncultured Massilia sp.]
MLRNETRAALIGVVLLGAAVLVACGGEMGGERPAPVNTLGTLAVSLTDAPACGFDAVNVTVDKVRVHRSAAALEGDAGWTDIALHPARKINLLNLSNGALEALGQATLEAGHYAQLRLVLGADAGGMAHTVVPHDGRSELPLETRDADSIRLAGAFEVRAGHATEVVLDFDACKSVLTRGKGRYALKPSVKVVPVAANGITGFVSTALLGHGVQVSAQQDGVIVGATTPDPATGEFFLSRLAPGDYDVVITADNSAASVVAGVPVASSTSHTVLSTLGAPILLAPGASGSIGGEVEKAAAGGEPVFVAAKQHVEGGPTVTIKYAGADLASGAYTIDRLPVGAPQFARYSEALPLAFSAGEAGGSYRIEASGGAAEEVDIGAANRHDVDLALLETRLHN